MKNTNTTLHQAAQLLQSYGWQVGKVEPVTTASEKDWIESRERAYRLADATDARAARMAAQATTIDSTGTATRIAPPPKAKRPKKAAPGTGTAAMFEVVTIVIASLACIG
jgi:hypothetical protein